MRRLVLITSLALISGVASADLLEEWTMTGGANGAALSTVPSTTGTGSTLGGSIANGQDIQNEQIHLFGAGTGAAFKGHTHTSYAGAASGIYQISYTVTAADLTDTSATDMNMQAGFGLRWVDSGNNDVRTLFRFLGSGGTDTFQLSIADSGGNTTVTVEESTILSDALTVRQVADLDTGDYKVYYTLGAASEVLAHDGDLHAGFELTEFRQQFQTINGGNGMAATDDVFMDNVSLTLIPEASSVSMFLLGGLLTLVVRRMRR